MTFMQRLLRISMKAMPFCQVGSEIYSCIITRSRIYIYVDPTINSTCYSLARDQMVNAGKQESVKMKQGTTLRISRLPRSHQKIAVGEADLDKQFPSLGNFFLHSRGRPYLNHFSTRDQIYFLHTCSGF